MFIFALFAAACFTCFWFDTPTDFIDPLKGKKHRDWFLATTKTTVSFILIPDPVHFTSNVMMPNVVMVLIPNLSVSVVVVN